MKPVTKYQADDGRVFNTEAEAIKHDAKALSVKKLEKLLKPLPKNDNSEFANGGGFVQQDSIKVLEYKRGILLLGAVYNSKFAEWAKDPISVHPQSIVGRILDDNDRLLYDAWYRLMCMDEQYRGWGQPYFASNPDKGKQFEAA